MSTAELTRGAINEKCVHPEIAELEKPLGKILGQLRRHIDMNQYKLVLGDDTSGRIPALIMWRVLSALAEQRGQEKPKISFIAGSRYLFDQDRQKKWQPFQMS